MGYKPSNIEILGDLYKKCYKCKRYRQLKYYNLSRYHVDQVTHTCIFCLAKGKVRGRRVGFQVSEETKDKIRKKATGTKLSSEHKRAISKALMGNQNRRTNYTTVIDNLYTDYVHTYKDENIGIWITKNKKALEESNIKTEHELSSMTIRDLKLFEIASSDIISIDPIQYLLTKEKLHVSGGGFK